MMFDIQAFVLPAEFLDQENTNDSARIYNNLGIERFRAGDFEEAALLLKRSIKIKRREQGPLSNEMATTYTNLGAVFGRLFNSADAMLYYDSAGYVFLDNYGPDHFRLGAVYQNQGNILRGQRDINSALAYYGNALRIFLKNERHDWVATLYNNIGITYWMAGNYVQAKEHYIRSMDIRQNIDPAAVAIPAGNLAICYNETGDLAAADEYYRIAIDAISGSRGREHPDLATNLMNYGLFLISNAQESDRGYENLELALDIFRTSFGEKDHQVARTYMNIGYYHELKGNLAEALNFYQKSLIANSESFGSADIADNPGVEDHVFSLDYMLATLKHKAHALYLLAGSSNRRVNLESSLTVYRSAMAFIEKLRMGHHTEESQLLLSESEHETFMRAIHVSYTLYELTGRTDFLEEAFTFSERSKSASLLASLRDVEARSFGGVPAELLEKEQSLKRGIAAYRELIYEEQRIVDADRDKIALWQERVFSLELEMRQLIGRLEDEYNDYYSLKYNRNVSDVSGIMNTIGPRDAIVSYVFNDSLIYIFTITGRKADFYCVPLDTPLESKLEKLLEVLTSGNLDRSVSEDYNTFTGISHELYNLLVDPLTPGLNNKRLIIIPDGIISYVPFELLLSSGAGPGTGNYKNLSYLLRDFTISYSYSATLWQESLQKGSGTGRRLLAMAPKYEFQEVPSQEAFYNRQYYRDKLIPLPGARQEAEKIAMIMEGDILLDGQATEQNFKNLAGNYNLLHLAMHTLIDDENPMFSKLVFSDSGDNEEDGFLNTYEIYNLSLKAGLAVLSSCRSGYGTLNRGEGVMSLARGFLYAGVPSIVMTNWEVEDKSGAEIMISFYKYLLKGFRKDEALRMARIDFLDNVDMLRSHPYFWGAYVCIGNPEELFNSFRQYYPVATFIVLILAMLIIIWRVGSGKS